MLDIFFTGLGKSSIDFSIFLYFALNLLIDFCALFPIIFRSDANKLQKNKDEEKSL